MALLQQPTSHSNPFAQQIGDAPLAPAGTFVSTVLDIRDEFGVKRTKFQSAEIETVDLTAFLFGSRDAQGVPHKVASRQMKISGNEKSALFGFLKSMLGKAPAYGWDYCSLRGPENISICFEVPGVPATVHLNTPPRASFQISSRTCDPVVGGPIGSKGVSPAY